MAIEFLEASSKQADCTLADKVNSVLLHNAHMHDSVSYFPPPPVGSCHISVGSRHKTPNLEGHFSTVRDFLSSLCFVEKLFIVAINVLG
jgi:hypothetical protein